MLPGIQSCSGSPLPASAVPRAADPQMLMAVGVGMSTVHFHEDCKRFSSRLGETEEDSD